MGSKEKKNLRKGLVRYRADPSSDAYHKWHAKAVAAGIPLPSRYWSFPDPVAADDGAAAAAAATASPPRPEGGGGGGGVQPADLDAALAAAKREFQRLKMAKWRANMKQKVAEEAAKRERERLKKAKQRAKKKQKVAEEKARESNPSADATTATKADAERRERFRREVRKEVLKELNRGLKELNRRAF